MILLKRDYLTFVVNYMGGERGDRKNLSLIESGSSVSGFILHKEGVYRNP